MCNRLRGYVWHASALEGNDDQEADNRRDKVQRIDAGDPVPNIGAPVLSPPVNHCYYEAAQDEEKVNENMRRRRDPAIQIRVQVPGQVLPIMIEHDHQGGDTAQACMCPDLA